MGPFPVDGHIYYFSTQPGSVHPIDFHTQTVISSYYVCVCVCACVCMMASHVLFSCHRGVVPIM